MSGVSKRPILDPSFWRERLQRAQKLGQLHRAVFETSPENWAAICARHRQILAEHIQPGDSVLDAGCGWGRLLDLMPATWRGRYCGVDLSPDFVALARELHPERAVFKGDLRDLCWLPNNFCEWAILVSVRPMVLRELGADVWAEMERELRRVARRLLYLEYDPSDPGSVE